MHEICTCSENALTETKREKKSNRISCRVSSTWCVCTLVGILFEHYSIEFSNWIRLSMYLMTYVCYFTDYRCWHVYNVGVDWYWGWIQRMGSNSGHLCILHWHLYPDCSFCCRFGRFIFGMLCCSNGAFASIIIGEYIDFTRLEGNCYPYEKRWPIHRVIENKRHITTIIYHPAHAHTRTHSLTNIITRLRCHRIACIYEVKVK